jgi:hypothetical protein
MIGFLEAVVFALFLKSAAKDFVADGLALDRERAEEKKRREGVPPSPPVAKIPVTPPTWEVWKGGRWVTERVSP